MFDAAKSHPKNKFDLLPPNSSADDQKNANFLVDGLRREINLSTLPLETNASLLPHLAVAYGVSIAGLSESEAREYLNSAFEIHRHKGTVYAVKKAIKIMFSDAELVESFDDDALGVGDFRVDVTVKPDMKQRYDAKRFATAKELINDSKNVRSYLVGFNVKLPDSKCDIQMYGASAVDVKMACDIEPFDSMANMKVGGAIVWNF